MFPTGELSTWVTLFLMLTRVPKCHKQRRQPGIGTCQRPCSFSLSDTAQSFSFQGGWGVHLINEYLIPLGDFKTTTTRHEASLLSPPLSDPNAERTSIDLSISAAEQNPPQNWACSTCGRFSVDTQAHQANAYVWPTKLREATLDYVNINKFKFSHALYQPYTGETQHEVNPE